VSNVDRYLLNAGFFWRNGELQAGGGSRPVVRLAPIRDRYQITISVPSTGNCVVFDIPKSAIKIKREGASSLPSSSPANAAASSSRPRGVIGNGARHVGPS